MVFSVTIHECRDLVSSKKADVYVKVICGDNKAQTTCKKNAGGAHVAFEETLTIEPHGDSGLVFSVMDKDILKDSELGRLYLPYQAAIGPVRRVTYQLEHKSNPVGSLTLSVSGR